MKLHLCIFFALASLLTGCASTANYTFVYLKTGPESSKKTKEESSKIFAGHMSNMKRLADEKKLIIAGPFTKPVDATWRGIFILDVASVEAARELVSTDPGIQSGVFVQECHSFKSTPDLRRTIQLEKEQNANAEPAKPGEPPKNIRAYVMITARDTAKARKAVSSSDALSKALIFSGTFSDDPTAVFVLDAQTVQEVRDIIAAEKQIWENAQSMAGGRRLRSWD